jgi:hypothetical protein
MVKKNQLLPTSGTVIVSTRETLARLMAVQKVNSAACPLLGTITPSNLHRRNVKTYLYNIVKKDTMKCLNYPF